MWVNANFERKKFVPPWSQTVNGSLTGASAESSIDDPEINPPVAIITLWLYPGIFQGSGVTNESIGE